MERRMLGGFPRRVAAAVLLAIGVSWPLLERRVTEQMVVDAAAHY